MTNTFRLYIKFEGHDKLENYTFANFKECNNNNYYYNYNFLSVIIIAVINLKTYRKLNIYSPENSS